MLESELKVALDEIGLLEPWWSDEDGMFVFYHEAYPGVVYADPDKQKAIEGYLRALKGFIQERMAGNIAESTENATTGKAGKRQS